METINRAFVPTDFGWVSPSTPPVNHNDVVILIFNKQECIYEETIGFYEGGNWDLRDYYIDECDVLGWFPYPFSPNNN